jgi:hypothetical protein
MLKKTGSSGGKVEVERDERPPQSKTSSRRPTPEEIEQEGESE